MQPYFQFLIDDFLSSRGTRSPKTLHQHGLVLSLLGNWWEEQNYPDDPAA